MSGLDRRHPGNGEPGPESGPARFFPGPAGRPGGEPPPHTPLPAPPQPSPAPDPGAATGAKAVPMTLHGSPGDVTVAVEGRITIEDAVIEKIAVFAAQEVGGAAPGTGGQHAAGRNPSGPGAGPGVRVAVDGDEVTLDLAIAVDYGTVIRDVAALVQENVARVVGMMLGARVAAVNVTVQDVRMPAGPDARPGARGPGGRDTGPQAARA